MHSLTPHQDAAHKVIAAARSAIAANPGRTEQSRLQHRLSLALFEAAVPILAEQMDLGGDGGTMLEAFHTSVGKLVASAADITTGDDRAAGRDVIGMISKGAFIVALQMHAVADEETIACITVPQQPDVEGQA